MSTVDGGADAFSGGFSGALWGLFADPLADAFGRAQQLLFEQALQPVLYAAGASHLLEDGYRATAWLLAGVLQVLVMLTLLRALEHWRPVEAVTDPAAVRTDVLYTLVHRLGLFRVVLFFTLDPLWTALAAELRLLGVDGFSVDALWPGVSDQALVSFVLYLLLFDLVDYALHRAQHRFGWWWALHALHHSQRQMTLWSDTRNHVLDDALRDAAFVAVALAVGMPPGQFIAVVACTQLLESLSHANVRLRFPGLLGRLLVGPQFHRVHHAIGSGPASHTPGSDSDGGCNYAVLFPVWDVLFRSARFDDAWPRTGIRDQLDGRDYGGGLWAQQRLGLVRLWDALRRGGGQPAAPAAPAPHP